jgi:aminoglycoside 3-N-acetyltransferase
MKKRDLETRKRENARVTKEDIKKGLKRLGLKRGDVVGVHSSLSSFGYVEGGADAVIDALLETVGKEGTIVMPTYSANREDVERSEREVELGVTWKSRILPYDAKKTPCTTGRIPETFRKRTNAVRSLDPAHSLAAIGPKANELIKDWDKLLEADGYILLLGVDLAVCSAMHLAERQVQMPQHILEKVEPPRELLGKYGEDLGWPEWDIGFGPYPDFAKMEEPCREHGIMKTVKIGEATIRFLRLRELIDLYAEYLRKNPDLFYRTK